MGEILLGIKWSPVTDGSIDDKLDGPRDGQLQVYVVEGAGMVDEDTHKPFNAFIKWYVEATPPISLHIGITMAMYVYMYFSNPNTLEIEESVLINVRCMSWFRGL